MATALGIFLVLSPKAVLFAGILFVLSVAISRFISLGSVVAALAMPLLILFSGQPKEIFAGALCITGLIVWRHRVNLRRMLDGTENRFRA